MEQKSEQLRALAAAYVNGTLSDDDRAAVEAALASDPALAGDVAAFAKISEAVKSNTDPAFDATEFGWQRLRKSLSETENARTSDSTFATVQDAGVVAAAMRSRPANENSAIWRIAAAVLGIIAIGQAILIAQPARVDGNDGYVTAGAETPASFTIKVSFQSDAAMGDVTALLERVDGTLISGPSAVGLYRVSFETADARISALDVLAGNPDLIDIAASE